MDGLEKSTIVVDMQAKNIKNFKEMSYLHPNYFLKYFLFKNILK
jgi:hypothetical protein